MTYYEWLNSKGCGCNNGCRDINPCSCDEILLEISNLHTDDQVLQDEIDSKQDELIEGNGIVIDENNVISVTGGTEGISSAQCQSMIDEAVSGKADSNSVYSKTESDNKYQLKGDYVTGVQMSAFTYDKQTIDDKIAEGGTFDPTQYYNKTQTNALLDLKADTANTYTKSEVNGLVADKADTTALTQVNNAVTAHTSNTTVHVTASEKSTWNNKSDFSGNYNDLTNKPTIPNYTAGSGITISNNVISAKIWSGTQAQYDALSTKDADTIYLIYNS